MPEFFRVTHVDEVLDLRERFDRMGIEQISLDMALGRVLGDELTAAHDIPGFDRSTMDGFAVKAGNTYGASETNPAYLTIVGAVAMGRAADFSVGAGQAARIATGGMLPRGADSVVMVEHTDVVDDTTIEVHHSAAPGQNVIARDEDAAAGQVLLKAGTVLRPQEIGVLAACGQARVRVYKRPRVGIISSGDEVVPVDAPLEDGRIRDVNTYTLSGMVAGAGGVAISYGIVKDNYEDLLATCRRAIAETDLVLVSGGSSVGTRDLTVTVLEALEESRILIHGVSLRPGKPTILAQCGGKAFWGLPGHVASAMVVFWVLVKPFLTHIGGVTDQPPMGVRARLTRNLSSVQGRADFVRVRLVSQNGELWAQPVLGASGLIRTMVAADGLVEIDMNSEGLDQGTWVNVLLI